MVVRVRATMKIRVSIGLGVKMSINESEMGREGKYGGKSEGEYQDAA